MDSKEWYWNTGLFLSNTKYLRQCLCGFLPSVLPVGEIGEKITTIKEEEVFVRENFPRYPNISLDYGVLEKSENVYVMKCDFGWADLGTWHGVYESMSKREGDNVVIDSDVILEDSANNIIKLSKGKLGIINGLDGYIIVEKDNVLFICKKEESSSLVRKYANEVQIKKGEEFL